MQLLLLGNHLSFALDCYLLQACTFVRTLAQVTALHVYIVFNVIAKHATGMLFVLSQEIDMLSLTRIGHAQKNAGLHVCRFWFAQICRTTAYQPNVYQGMIAEDSKHELPDLDLTHSWKGKPWVGFSK